MPSLPNIYRAAIITLATIATIQPALATSHPENLEGLNQLSSLSTRRGLSPRASRISGGCAHGEVAVGTWKTCSPSPGGICNPGGCSGTDGGCGAELGAVWDKDCGGSKLMSTVMTEGFCKGGWHGDGFLGGDIGVRCNGNDVDAVTVAGVDGVGDMWAKCYKPDKGECQWTIGIASAYANIEWCCGVEL